MKYSSSCRAGISPVGFVLLNVATHGAEITHFFIYAVCNRGAVLAIGPCLTHDLIPPEISVAKR